MPVASTVLLPVINFFLIPQAPELKTIFNNILGDFLDLFEERKQWHLQELWINARLVIRLFMWLICCPLKDYLIINLASNAATAKDFSRYIYFSLVTFYLCFDFATHICMYFFKVLLRLRLERLSTIDL